MMRGNLTLATTSLDAVEWAAGVAMIPTEQAEAAIFPDPAFDAAFPWAWFDGGTSKPSIAGETTRYPIFSKAKRRFLEFGARLYLIIDNHDANHTFQAAVNLRLLYALP